MSFNKPVIKSFKYRMYTSRNDKTLHNMIDIASDVWNYCVTVQQRYYRLFGKTIGRFRLGKSLVRLRSRTNLKPEWRKLYAHSLQVICQKIDLTYKMFFKTKGVSGLPKTVDAPSYTSFTLKDNDWQLRTENPQSNYRKITVRGVTYKFIYSRAIPEGASIKTVTIRRDAKRRLWISFSAVLDEKFHEPLPLDQIHPDRIAGFDFGLKTFLTVSDGRTFNSPQFFRHDLPRLSSVQIQVWSKSNNSRNQARGKRYVAHIHDRISNKRREYHYALAHQLCDLYDVLVFEDLDIESMKRVRGWGRKVSDLGFSQFMLILQWIASKRGKRVITIGRYERTTGVCSGCGHTQSLTLNDRTFECEACGLTLDRDLNASINIRRIGCESIGLKYVPLLGLDTL